jgi:hypothetical protein
LIAARARIMALPSDPVKEPAMRAPRVGAAILSSAAGGGAARRWRPALLSPAPIRSRGPHLDSAPARAATDWQGFAGMMTTASSNRDPAPMATSAWRAQRNAKALARLRRNLPGIFPGCVLLHALARPFVPPTPRRAVESYWRHHPVRADRLARALAARSGAPNGWTWRIERREASGAGGAGGAGLGFRAPPAPFREKAHAKGPGTCCVCGQPVFRFGWHRDLWGDAEPNRNASWHACCVAAWKLWTAPSGHVRHLRRLQQHRCAVSGARLARDAEVDHRVPLFAVWRDPQRAAATWPALLRFWGVPNLQVINRSAHVEKCGRESVARARSRRAGGPDLAAD